MLQFNFEEARKTLFPKYSQLQVDSINAIVKEANDYKVDKYQLAYILATAYHEAYDYTGNQTGTIQRLVPIHEGGSLAYLKSKKYYPHIGRGFVQLTWERNYEKYRKPVLDKFGVDIVKNPEAVMRIDIAAFIIVDGIMKGHFNGKGQGLSYYVNSTKQDYINARRTVNLLDKASLIAGYAKKFEKVIN